VFLGLLDPKRKTLHYLNAGHPPAVLWRPGREPRLLPATTPLLSFGIDLGREPTAKVPFEPGDRLGAYSDGLYEMRDPDGNEYGRERLNTTLTGATGTIEDAVRAAREATEAHAAGRPAEDDLTMFVVEFQKK